MPAPDYSTEVAALERALSSGELTVESDGDRVTYRSITDVRAALDYFQRKAAAASGMQTRGSSVATFSKD